MLGMAGDGLCLFLKIEGLWNWENIFFFCKSEFLHAYHSHLTFMPKYPGGVLNSEHPFRRLQERADSPLSARRAAKWNPAVMFHKPRVHVASSVGHWWPLSAGTQGVLGGSARTPSCSMQSPNHRQVTPQEVMTHLLCVREMGACLSRRRSPGWWAPLAAS